MARGPRPLAPPQPARGAADNSGAQPATRGPDPAGPFRRPQGSGAEAADASLLPPRPPTPRQSWACAPGRSSPPRPGRRGPKATGITAVGCAAPRARRPPPARPSGTGPGLRPAHCARPSSRPQPPPGGRPPSRGAPHLARLTRLPPALQDGRHGPATPAGTRRPYPDCPAARARGTHSAPGEELRSPQCLGARRACADASRRAWAAGDPVWQPPAAHPARLNSRH